MPATKTIFLDFDGVLHPASARTESLFSQAELLIGPITKYQPHITISSSWRFHLSPSEIVAQLPVEVRYCVTGFTGDAFIGRHARWNEIQAYCRLHRITDWAALDDSAFEFPTPCPQLIRCNPNTGIQERQISALVAWLGDWKVDERHS
jgi:hypothetical protein